MFEITITNTLVRFVFLRSLFICIVILKIGHSDIRHLIIIIISTFDTIVSIEFDLLSGRMDSTTFYKSETFTRP